jgi:Acyl-CoA dehydrogenase, middle domain/Acyl-CoA dehydrogenase, N-terminal domain
MTGAIKSVKRADATEAFRTRPTDRVADLARCDLRSDGLSHPVMTTVTNSWQRAEGEIRTPATSERARTIRERLLTLMDEHIYPNEARYHEELNALPNRFSTVPLMEELKAKARAAQLWNLWLPAVHGGLTNLEYAPQAEVMGRVLWSPEAFNCNAPDTGNMEVLLKYGNETQKAAWLEPLLAGEIRSSYCMTEPQVASSDATNIETTITRDGDDYVVSGRKWFISNPPYERTKIFIVMGVSDAANPSRHLRHSQILVPKNAEGITIVRPLTTLGYDDAPLGHAEVRFDNVRIPSANNAARRRSWIRDRSGAPRSRPDPLLHALDRQRAAGARIRLPARRVTRHLRAQALRASVGARRHREVVRGDRASAAADDACRGAHGRGRPQRSTRHDRRGEDHGATDGADGDRPLHADPRGRRPDGRLPHGRGVQLCPLVRSGGPSGSTSARDGIAASSASRYLVG